MGCFLSTAAADGSDNVDEVIESLSYYYDEACRLDPTLRSLAASLSHRTGAVSALSADDRSISLHSLEQAVDNLSDVGTDASIVLLELRDEIKSDPELASFVREYFRRSVDILKFFTEFLECLSGARRIEATALDAVACLDNDDLAGASRKLGEIIAAGDPFANAFVDKVASVLEQQRQLRKALQDERKKLEQKLKSSESWKTVCSLVFAIAFVATLICSIVLAAVSAPPAAIAAAAAVSAAAVPLREWVNSLRKACVGKIKQKKSVVKKLGNGAYSNIHELNNIKEAAKNVDIRLQDLLKYAEFGITDDEDAAAMRAAVVEIKATLGKFTRSIERLENNVERCRQRLRRTTAAILKAVKDDDL